jgi:putative restriction endonuclease
MIDACHIIPFSESYNDTITNGIALSPSIHRAFDRMLITINADYIIRVSPTVTETESPFSLQQFDGKQILLPEKSEYHPSIESLSWHNSRFVL